jgi:hypothetical protein
MTATILRRGSRGPAIRQASPGKFEVFDGSAWVPLGARYEGRGGEQNPLHPTYGAVGNGVANDTTPILNALAAAAGGMLALSANFVGKVSSTLSVPSNTSILGAGPTSVLKAATGMNVPLITIPDGAHDITISATALDGAGLVSSAPLIKIGNDCYNITIFGDVSLQNIVTKSVSVGLRAKNIQLGPQKRTVDAPWFGVKADGAFFESAAVTSGTRAVRVEGGLPIVVGQSYSVQQAGVSDSAGGRNNWIGTIATVTPGTVASTNGAIASASFNLADTTANFTAALTPVGSPITVAGAGASAGLHSSTIAAIVDSTHVTLADAALTTVVSGAAVSVSVTDFTASGGDPTASATVTGMRGEAAWDDSPRIADMVAAGAAIGALAVRFAAGNIYVKLDTFPLSKMAFLGAGEALTRIRGGRHASAFKVHSVTDVTIKDMTLEGAGPDGGDDGASNATAVLDVKASKRVWITNVRLRYGACGFTAREQGTEDIFLSNVLVEDITSSNGTTIIQAGIAYWVFSNVKRLHATGITARNISRHGWHFDSGTTTQTGPTQHGPPQNCTVTDLTLENVCQVTNGGALLFGGAEDCSVGVLTVNGTGVGGDGISFTADQNGEYAKRCSVGVAHLKNISGVPLQFASSEDCSVPIFDLQDFNLDQNASYKTPINFGGYGSVNDGVNNGGAAKSTIAGHDCLNNWVGVANIRYGVDLTKYRGNGGAIAAGVADPTMYDYSAIFTGAAVIADATVTAGSLRWMRTRGNQVHQLRSTPLPSNGIGSAAYSSTAVTVAGVATTNGSPTMTRTRGSTFVPFNATDLPNGTSISGTGIPASSTVRVVDADTLTIRNSTDTADVNATASGTITLTITLPVTKYLPITGGDANFVGLRATKVGAGVSALQVAVASEDFARLEIDSNGAIRFGAGSTATDATLSRLQGGVLQVATGALVARKQVISYAADGAITVRDGIASITKSSAAALTLANPTSGTDDGTELTIIDRVGFAHTVCYGAGCGGSGSGFDAGGAGKDLATFSGSKGDTLVLVALGASGTSSPPRASRSHRGAAVAAATIETILNRLAAALAADPAFASLRRVSVADGEVIDVTPMVMLDAEAVEFEAYDADFDQASSEIQLVLADRPDADPVAGRQRMRAWGEALRAFLIKVQRLPDPALPVPNNLLQASLPTKIELLQAGLEDVDWIQLVSVQWAVTWFQTRSEQSNFPPVGRFNLTIQDDSDADGDYDEDDRGETVTWP